MNFDTVQSAVTYINNSSKCRIQKELTDALRYLRNACAEGTKVQNEIIADKSIVTSVHRILKISQEDNTDSEKSLCLTVGVQFLANLLVDNHHNQKIIWDSCQDLLNLCLVVENPKVQNCSAMIFYNIFLGHTELLSELSQPYADLIKLTLNESTSEFAVYTLELFILRSNYIEKYYSELNSECRLIILEIFRGLISKDSDERISLELIHFYVEYFKRNSDCILKTVSTYVDSLDPVEIVKVLEILATFSNDDRYYLKILQKETSLLINCLFLLKCVHNISKENGNNFTMLQKLSDIEELEKTTTIQEHPAFGFKCSLIRIIGNLCWKNIANQDKVRELGCLHVLLDCCNIDGRNPFITQWTILAVRNICEKNFENQKFIASMSKAGVVDTAKLQEMGIMLNLDKNVSIAPLKTDN